MTPRWYQIEAPAAAYSHLRNRKDNPCIVLPTGAGKTIVIATMVRDAVERWGGRVLVLAHVKELLEQNADRIGRLAPDVPVGVYSAGLGRRDTSQPCIVAGIQSVYKRGTEFDPFDLVVVDEAHLIPTDGDGMYRQLLADLAVVNPRVRVVGLTATPYRLKGGWVCTPENILNEVCYEVGVRDLIAEGFLSKLTSRVSKQEFDTSSARISGGDFVGGELGDQLSDNDLVRAACEEIVARTADRQRVLIFGTNVLHAWTIAETLKAMGQECGLVTGDMPAVERREALEAFACGGLKYLANVNVLTTGFDCPSIDCVTMLRPTLSPGLYYQMVGRGLRIAEGKTDCLVLDFGGNIRRHGPIDQMDIKTSGVGQGGEAPVKVCPECDSPQAAGRSVCADCGYVWPEPELKHDATPDGAAITSDQVVETSYTVGDIDYQVWHKRDAPDDAPRTMCVTYRIGLAQRFREWVCFEHSGFARDKAEAWWSARSARVCPDDSEHAVDIARAGGLATATKITVRDSAASKWPEIVGYTVGEIPGEVAVAGRGFEDEDIPF